VGNNGINTVSVFRNTSPGSGTISFATKVDYPAGTQPISVSIGDLDGDGKADLVVANSSSNTISVFRNTTISAGTISFAAKVDYTAGSAPRFISIGDLDGDGKADLAVANHTSNTVSVFRNTSISAGTISLANKVDYPAGTNTRSVSIGDLDGDGKADLVVTNNGSNTVSVFRNTGTTAGTISYAAKVDYMTGENPPSVSIGDLDGDGKADLAVANYTSNTVSVFRNLVNGTSSPVFENAFAGFEGVDNGAAEWGDLDGDGDLDFILIGRDLSNNPISKVYVYILGSCRG